MTKKEKNKLRERLSKLKQVLMIVLMLVSGIWYVTMGRAENKASFELYSESSEVKKQGNVKKTGNTGADLYYPEESCMTETSETQEIKAQEDISESEYNPSDIPSGSEPEYNPSDIPSGSESEYVQSDKPSGSGYKGSSPVNINKADLNELESIPGVGPATAKNIIEYREKYGGFADIGEIKNVKRIGDKTYEKLKGYITV